jgi:hypothetical protein
MPSFTKGGVAEGLSVYILTSLFAFTSCERREEIAENKLSLRRAEGKHRARFCMSLLVFN